MLRKVLITVYGREGIVKKSINYYVYREMKDLVKKNANYYVGLVKKLLITMYIGKRTDCEEKYKLLCI